MTNVHGLHLSGKACIHSRAIRVGFVLDKVILRQVFSEYFGLFLSISFYRARCSFIYQWGMDNGPIRGYVAPTHHTTKTLNGHLRQQLSRRHDSMCLA